MIYISKIINIKTILLTLLCFNAYNTYAYIVADELYQPTKINNFIKKHLTLSANAALKTNYVWRGVSQTDDGPAAQAGFKLNSDYGPYIGAWGSNVNFTDLEGRQATSETDLFYGYTNKIKGLTLDLNALYYLYDNHTKLNYWEYSLYLAYSIAHAKIHYIPHVFHTDEAFYYTGGISYPLPIDDGLIFKDLTANVDIGHYQFNSGFYKNLDYYDYKLALDRKLNEHFSLGLSFTGTNGKFNSGSLDDKKITATINAAI